MSLRKSVVLPPNLLKDVPLDELKKIANNDDSFGEYFLKLQLDEIVKVNNDRDKIVQKNREIGAETLALKPQFEEKKAKLVQSNMEATELKESYNKLYEKLKLMGKGFDQKSLLKDLRDLARDSEREADNLTDEFLDKSNDIDVDSFIKKFVDCRITFWSRKVKAEKMDELIKQGVLQVGPSSSMGGQPIPYPPYSTGGSSMPPYPSGGGSSMPSTSAPYPLGGPSAHSLSTPQVRGGGTSPVNQRRSLPTQSLGTTPPYQAATVQQTQPQYSVPPYQPGASYSPQGYPSQPQQTPPYPGGGGYPPQGSYPPQPSGHGYPPSTQYRQPPPSHGRQYYQRRF